jgi:peptidoglycan hydrolase CwlO-like protein
MTKKLADIEVPVSAITRNGMSLNPDDQKWIKTLLDLQNDSWSEAFDLNVKQLTCALAEVIQESNNRMFAVLDEQNKMIRGIQEDIKDIKQSIEHLNLDIKDIRLEIKAVKVEVKGISLEIENLQNRIKDHDFRLLHLEKKMGV